MISEFKNMFNTGSTYIPRLIASGEFDNDEMGEVFSSMVSDDDITQPMEDDVFGNVTDINNPTKIESPYSPEPESLTTEDIRNFFFVKTAYVTKYNDVPKEIDNEALNDLLAMQQITKDNNVKFHDAETVGLSETKWFAEYFNTTFRFGGFRNRKGVTTVYIDYLQKDLLLDFKNSDECYTVKISPVRLLKCSYKDTDERTRNVHELVGSHKYNELVTKLLSNNSIHDFNDARIVGYIIEVFKPNKEGIPVPIKNHEMKSVLKRINISEEQFVEDMKVDLNLASSAVGTGKYVYLMRESHSVSLGKIKKQDGSNEVDIESFINYCNAAQDYYRKLLRAEDIQAMNWQEYFRNYTSSLLYLTVMVTDRDSAKSLCERIGIYLPKIRNLGSSTWYGTPISLDSHITQSTRDVNSITLNEELIMNYMVGGFVPVFAVDFHGSRHDPYQGYKMEIIKFLKDFKTTRVYQNKEEVESKLFTYGKEMVIPPNLNNEDYVRYNPNNIVDKYGVNIIKGSASFNKHSDIDFLDIIDDIKDKTPEHLVVCNVSFNSFVADELRSRVDKDWYVGRINPLPIDVFRLQIKAE